LNYINIYNQLHALRQQQQNPIAVVILLPKKDKMVNLKKLNLCSYFFPSLHCYQIEAHISKISNHQSIHQNAISDDLAIPSSPEKTDK